MRCSAGHFTPAAQPCRLHVPSKAAVPQPRLLSRANTRRDPQPGALTGKSVADFPKLLDEWHAERNGGLQPAQVQAGSHRRVWWRCAGCPFCGLRHEWQASCVNRTANAAGCPFCSRRGTGRTCVCSSIARHPQLSAEFDADLNYPLRAEQLSVGSARLVAWRCLAGTGHPPFRARVKSRTGTHPSGCPLCAKELPRTGSLQEEFPTVAAEWDADGNAGTSATRVRAGSTRKAAWRCRRCGSGWRARVKDRTLKGTRCPACMAAATLAQEVEPPVEAKARSSELP